MLKSFSPIDYKTMKTIIASILFWGLTAIVAPALAQNNFIVHHADGEENLMGIARMYGISTLCLKQCNKLAPNTYDYTVPDAGSKWAVSTVAKWEQVTEMIDYRAETQNNLINAVHHAATTEDDSFYRIYSRYGATAADFMQWNGIDNIYLTPEVGMNYVVGGQRICPCMTRN